MSGQGLGHENLDLHDPEVSLGMLLAEYSTRLAQNDILSIVRDSLKRLADTIFYYTDDQKQVVAKIASSLDDTFPILRVTAGRAYEDNNQTEVGTLRQPTGEVEFNYSISLNTPWGVEDDPLGYDIKVGDLIVLDGTEFRINIGKVLVSPNGGARFVKAEIGKDPHYTTRDTTGNPRNHPDPESLFPHFSPMQENELRSIALDTTDAFVNTYGLDPDVLWDRTSGIWWDVKAPGAREMWKRVNRQFGLESLSSGFEQPD